MTFLVHQSLLNYANNVLFSTKLCGIAFNNMLFKKIVEAELEKEHDN